MKAAPWPEGGCVDGSDDVVGGATVVLDNFDDCVSVATDLRERF